MPQIRKRPQAKRDLVDHFSYLEEHGSIRVANRFLSAAEKTMETLAKLPFSGTLQQAKHTELSGMRKRLIKGFQNHLIFYFPLPDGIDVVRIVHAARDLERLFEDEFI
jgi:toxin ParE1/3/4